MHCKLILNQADVVLELPQDYQLKNIEQMCPGRESMGAELHCQWMVSIVSRKQELKVHKTMTKIASIFSFYVACILKAEEHIGQLMLGLIS